MTKTEATVGIVKRSLLLAIMANVENVVREKLTIAIPSQEAGQITSGILSRHVLNITEAKVIAEDCAEFFAKR